MLINCFIFAFNLNNYLIIALIQQKLYIKDNKW
jgi:hypothetical protein